MENQPIDEYLVKDARELVQIAEFDQVEPRYVCNPFRWLWLHDVQIQSSTT